MIHSKLIEDLLEKCFAKKMKEQEDIENDEDEKEIEEKCKTKKRFQESFFGINYTK